MQSVRDHDSIRPSRYGGLANYSVPAEDEMPRLSLARSRELSGCQVGRASPISFPQASAKGARIGTQQPIESLSGTDGAPASTAMALAGCRRLSTGVKRRSMEAHFLPLVTACMYHCHLSLLEVHLGCLDFGLQFQLVAHPGVSQI